MIQLFSHALGDIQYIDYSECKSPILISFLLEGQQLERKQKGENEITFAYYTRMIPRLCLSRDFWWKIDCEIPCFLWSLNVMNPKYPHIFPDTLSLSYCSPDSRPCVWSFTLPKPLACLLQTTTSYHRTPAGR